MANNTIFLTKQLFTEWKNIFTYFTDDRGLISKIYINTQELDVKKPNNAIKKWNSDLKKIKLSLEETQVAVKQKKKFSILSQ